MQLEAFVSDVNTQAELRKLGANFLISGTEDPNHYNISLSGNFVHGRSVFVVTYNRLDMCG